MVDKQDGSENNRKNKTENKSAKDIDYYYFAVYDGHGQSGKEASQAANDFIVGYLER